MTAARWDVRHVTTYTYDDDVSDSYALAHVTPRSQPDQRVVRHAVDVDPVPVDRADETDHFGNTVTYLQVDVPHRVLTVRSESVVEVEEPVHDPDVLDAPWEQARPTGSDDWAVVEMALPSPSIAGSSRVTDYAAASLRPGRPVAEAVDDLVARVHADFEYRPGTTTVTSTIDDVLDAGAGVCQDFAQLIVACLRSHGLAARYVSGYLATDPPPGRDRVLGADATHAWAAVRLPDDSWLAVDPTNDQRAGSRYVTVAWGREYADVPPLKGVIFTEARESTLAVQVDVVPT